MREQHEVAPTRACSVRARTRTHMHTLMRARMHVHVYCVAEPWHYSLFVASSLFFTMTIPLMDALPPATHHRTRWLYVIVAIYGFGIASYWWYDEVGVYEKYNIPELKVGKYVSVSAFDLFLKNSFVLSCLLVHFAFRAFQRQDLAMLLPRAPYYREFQAGAVDKPGGEPLGLMHGALIISIDDDGTIIT